VTSTAASEAVFRIVGCIAFPSEIRLAVFKRIARVAFHADNNPFNK